MPKTADRFDPELAAFTEKLHRLFDFSAASVASRRSGPFPVGGTVAPVHAPGVCAGSSDEKDQL